MRSAVLSVCAVVIVVFSLLSMGEEREERVTYLESRTLLKCRVVLPEGYDAERKYPLVVGLHGRYADAEFGVAMWKMLDVDGVIYAALQGPYPEGDPGKSSWFKSDPEVKGLLDKSKVISTENIRQAAKYVVENYAVDPERVFLMGHSQGGAMTYVAGMKHHELFAGLIVFSGWLNMDYVGEELVKESKGLKVFIAHGKEDGNVRFGRGIEARDILKKDGYDVTFFGFNGGHGMSDVAGKEAAEWLRKKCGMEAKGEDTKSSGD